MRVGNCGDRQLGLLARECSGLLCGEHGVCGLLLLPTENVRLLLLLVGEHVAAPLWLLTGEQVVALLLLLATEKVRFLLCLLILRIEYIHPFVKILKIP